jgi:hypothetical protein
MKIEYIKKILQSCNINFLLGAGCSIEAIPGLGTIEQNLQDESKNEEAQKQLNEILRKCMSGDTSDQDFITSSGIYNKFFTLLYQVLTERESNTVSKQINIFTTNYDLFLENVCDQKQYLYNDGFYNGLAPRFDTSHFRKRYYQSSFHYNNIFELPSFNIYKLHGSASWKRETDSIYRRLPQVENSEIDCLDSIILPLPNKIETSVLNDTYYDLLRLLANTLDIENSVLFIVGHSLRDEHIAKIIRRALSTNLTLKVILVDYEHVLGEWEGPQLQILNSGDENMSFDNFIDKLSELFYKEKESC